MVMFPGGYVAWKSDLDVMRWGGITALALGMITLSPFFLFPRAHRMTSTLFFGFAGLAILGNIIFELFATGSFGPNGENAMEYGVRGVLLVASLVGFFTGRRRP